MVTTAIQVNLGMISLSDNEVTKRLAAWGALITVPTLIAGIYGMNFEHMPELEVGVRLSDRDRRDGRRRRPAVLAVSRREVDLGRRGRPRQRSAVRAIGMTRRST